MEKGVKHYKVELLIDGRLLDKDSQSAKISEILKTRIADTVKQESLSVGHYRGFGLEVALLPGDRNRFNFLLKGTGQQKLTPHNLVYKFGEPFSVSGFFQRVDNVLDKGLEANFQEAKQGYEREKTELHRVHESLDQPFPQQAELELTRQNHGAVMRELKRMQDEPGYQSTWTPQRLEASLDRDKQTGNEPAKQEAVRSALGKVATLGTPEPPAPQSEPQTLNPPSHRLNKPHAPQHTSLGL